MVCAGILCGSWFREDKTIKIKMIVKVYMENGNSQNSKNSQSMSEQKPTQGENGN